MLSYKENSSCSENAESRKRVNRVQCELSLQRYAQKEVLHQKLAWIIETSNESGRTFFATL